MRFRLSDEQAYCSPQFDADTPEELVAGIRDAWDAYIQAGWPGEASASRVLAYAPGADEARKSHPGLAHRLMLTRIEQWLERKLASDGDHRSWRAQADVWRYQVRRLCGETAEILHLQVLSETTAEWLSLGSGLTPSTHQSPRVPRRLGAEQANVLLRAAELVVQHDRNLSTLADHVSEAVREQLYPRPRLVKVDK